MQFDVSMNLSAGGDSQVVAISGASAPSAVFNAPAGAQGQFVLVSPTIDCFARQGAAPVALASGVDCFLGGGKTYRIYVPNGNKIAFITSGSSGSAYLTPGA